MPAHTLKPAADYLPKMGKKALSLLAAGVTPEMAPAQALEAIRAAWRNSVTTHVLNGLAKDIERQLGEIVEGHEMMFGERPDDRDKASVQYDSDLDDAVQEGFDLAFWAAMGASGQVEHTTDTRADLAERRTELGQRMAGEIIANGGWSVLSDAEAQAILDANPAKPARSDVPKPADPAPSVGTAEHPQTGISYESAWKTGVKLVKAALDAGTHDVLSISDELELCIDSDDILGTAGAQRLSPTSTPEVVRACMQILAGAPREDGVEWTEAVVMAALNDEAPTIASMTTLPADSTPAQVAEAFAEVRAEAAKPAERKTPAESSADAGHAHEVMVRYLALSGMSEQTMAYILGCSRAMVNAAAKGRKSLDWTPDRVARLKQSAMEHAASVATFQEEAGAL